MVNARELVRLAASRVEDRATKEWLFRDEFGTWERSAQELLDRMASGHPGEPLSDGEHSEIADRLALRALRAMLEQARKRKK